MTRAMSSDWASSRSAAAFIQRARSLVPPLASLTVDLALRRDARRPAEMGLALPQGGLTDVQQAEARAIALEVLIALRDGARRPAAALPSEREILRIMEYAVGGG